MVWSAGLASWKAAGEVDKLRALIPPPVPEEHWASMLEWKVRWWWYVVAVLFFGSIGSRDGRRAMEWASAERARRRKADRKQPRDQIESATKPETRQRKIFARRIRNPAIVGATVLYAYFIGKPPIIVSLLTGVLVGIAFIGVAEAIAWSLRSFRERLPRAAFYVGTTLFWLGLAVAVWCAGVSGYILYEGGPIRLVGIFVGCAAFYGLIGWGFREALVR